MNMVIIKSAHPTAQWIGAGCDLSEAFSISQSVRCPRGGKEGSLSRRAAAAPGAVCPGGSEVTPSASVSLAALSGRRGHDPILWPWVGSSLFHFIA